MKYPPIINVERDPNDPNRIIASGPAIDTLVNVVNAVKEETQMKPINDGSHRLDTSMFSVLVTPLDESYRGKWMRFKFAFGGKDLAVSLDDAAKIKRLLSGNVENRKIILSPEGDKIRISVSQ